MTAITKKSVHIAIIAVLGLVVYANTLHVPFFFDDYTNFINAPFIKSFSHFADPDLVKAFKGYDGFVSRYFGYLTFALNYHFHGLDVAGYHAVNIAIHLLSALLVYLLVTLTFRTPCFADAGDREAVQARAGFTALCAALLFVAHPLQTQAVTYLVQRFASLGAMLYLLSLTSYIRARLIQTARGNSTAVWAWYLAALVAALLAIKTKESTYTLPFVVLLYEIMFFKGKVQQKALALSIGVVVLLGSFIAFLVLWPGKAKWGLVVGIETAMRLQTNMSRLDYIATQFKVLVTYLRLLVFPVGQQLDYDYPVYRSFLHPEVLLSAAILLSLLAAAVYCVYLSRRRHRTLGDASPLLRLTAFGVFWFFITLSIESTIIPIVDVIFEHRMYLPAVGPFMAAAAILSLTFRKNGMIPGWPRVPVLTGAAAAVLILAGMAFARNGTWGNEVAFWQDNAGKSPQKARVYLNLGRAMERSGDFGGAEKAYQKATALAPGQTDSLVNLGLIYIQWGRLPDALTQFQAALKIDPNLAVAHNNIGKVYGIRSELDKALEHFLKAVQLDPNLAEPYNNIGYVYALQKRYPEALREYEKCLVRDPAYELAYVNRGMALVALGRNSEAIADFRRALEINPSHVIAAEQLQQAGSK